MVKVSVMLMVVEKEVMWCDEVDGVIEEYAVLLCGVLIMVMVAYHFHIHRMFFSDLVEILLFFRAIYSRVGLIEVGGGKEGKILPVIHFV